jgi:hypothetical protein
LAREVREPALQFTVHVRGQVAESLVLERGQLLAGLVALFVEFFARRQEGRRIGPGRAARRRHGLLPPHQFVVDIGAKLVELGG